MMGAILKAVVTFKQVFALVLLVLTTLATKASTLGFAPAQTYPVGTEPIAIAVGDFNGDGKLDVAVLNNGNAAVADDGGVSILLGKGDGTFQAAMNFAAGKNPSAIVSGDFNADAKDDLAIVRFGDPDVGDTGEVSVFLSNGDGTFQAGEVLRPGNNPSHIVAFDFNSDHNLDLAVLDFDSGSMGASLTISLLLGNGDGTFQAHGSYGKNFLRGTILPGDFNHDGKMDLAVGGLPGAFVLMDNGDGTFQAPVAAAALPLVVAAGDFNRDGTFDLLAQALPRGCGAFKICPGAIGEFIGNGDGTFRAPSSGVGINLGSGILGGGFITADLDGDGNLDLAGWEVHQGRFVVVLAGDGAGNFNSPVTFTAGTLPTVAAIADLNGDKAPELIAIVPADNTVAVLLNTVSTDFSISASEASPNTLSSGQSATSTISMNLLNAFDNPVSLACSVQPAQAGSPTCSLNPNSITFDASGKATAEMTITAGTTVVSFTQPPASANSQPVPLSWLPIVGFAVAGAGFRRAGSRRRRPLALFVGCVLFAGLIFQTACGGSSSGPKSQAYTITVTGKVGSTQHSTTVKLTVQ